MISVAIILIMAATAARGFADSPDISSDEGTYTAQAWSALHGSMTPYTYFYDHPPLGWLQIAPALWAGGQWNWSEAALQSARTASAVALVVDALLLLLIARRAGCNRLISVAVAAVFVFSPLTHEYLLRVYLDCIALPWILAAFAVALSKNKGVRHHVTIGALMAVASLTKETSLIFYPALLAATLTGVDRSAYRRIVAVCSGTLVIVSAAYPLWALMRGDLMILARSLGWQLIGRQGSGNLWDAGSVRHDVVFRWVSEDPTLIIVGVGLALVALLGTSSSRWVGLAVLVPALMCVRPGGYLPGMFVATALPFLSLSLGTAAASLFTVRRFSSVDHRPRRVLLSIGAAAVTLLFVVTDLRQARTTPAQTTGQPALAGWVQKNIPSDATVLVDDAVFAELYVHGRDDVWHQSLMVYKIDGDARADTMVPGGWTEVDYVVATPEVRRAAGVGSAVQARAALDHGVAIATFGSGTSTTTMLKVVH